MENLGSTEIINYFVEREINHVMLDVGLQPTLTVRYFQMVCWPAARTVSLEIGSPAPWLAPWEQHWWTDGWRQTSIKSRRWRLTMLDDGEALFLYLSCQPMSAPGNWPAQQWDMRMGEPWNWCHHSPLHQHWLWRNCETGIWRQVPVKHCA